MLRMNLIKWTLGILLCCASLAHAQPANDLCVNATVITLDTLTSGTTVDATGADLTGSACGQTNGDANDVWYSFTPSTAGVHVVDKTATSGFVHGENSDPSPRVSIFDSCGGDELAYARPTDPCQLFYGAAGTEYLIRVAGPHFTTGTFDLTVSFIGDPPANDLCENATVVEVDTAYFGSTDRATGAWLDYCALNGDNHTGDAGDVWYSFTPPANCEYLISTCGSDLDTTLAVLDSCGGNVLEWTDDDVCASGNQEEYALDLNAGQTYLIRVSGYGNERGDYELTVYREDCVGGSDDCAAASVLSYGIAHNGTTDGSTGADVTSCGSGDACDVWWQFTPDHDARYVLDTSGSATDTTLAIYSDHALLGTVGQGGTLSTLVAVNRQTGALTTIGPVGYAVNGIDWYDGVLYGTTSWQDPCFHGLITIDPMTGAGTRVGSGWGPSYDDPDFSDRKAIVELAIDSSGRAFGWNEPEEDDLYEINLAAGTTSLVGESGVETGVLGLAFDRSDRLYLINADPCEGVFEINPDTGAASFLGLLSGGSIVHHGDVDPGSGVYYGLSFPQDPRELHAVDLGTRSILSTVSSDSGLHTLAFAPHACQYPQAAQLACNNDYARGPTSPLACRLDSRVILNLLADQTYLVRVASRVGDAGEYNLLAALAGDVNLDGRVDLADLAEFWAVWWDNPNCSLADIDIAAPGDPPAGSNHDINEADLVRLSDQWLIGSSSSTAPGPNRLLTTSVSEGLGTISPPTGPQPDGAVVNLVADPCDGWQVKEWGGDAANKPAAGSLNNTVTMNADKNVTVAFELIPPVMHQLITSVSEGFGTIAPPSGQQPDGAVVNLVADPCDGWQVKEWGGDAANKPAAGSLNNTVTMDSAKNVTVAFEEIACTERTLNASVVDGLGGIIMPAGATQHCDGTAVSLIADPCDGWVVQGWTGAKYGNGFTDPCNIVIMDGNKNVTVAFQNVGNFTLTTIVLGGNGALAPPTGPQTASTTVDLVASPDLNFVVAWWSGTDNDGSTALTNTVTMDGNKTVYVGFDPEEEPE